MKACVIVGAGSFFGFTPDFPRDAFVIAADGGYERCAENGILPDLLVGDFDSLSFAPSNVQIIRLPVQKDETDTAFSIETGLSRECDAFYIYGGTGGRLDHTLANIANLAALAKKKARGYLFGKDYFLTAICNEELHFSAEALGNLSVFSHSDRSTGVDIRGLKYELSDAVLASDTPLGVSNAFSGKPSCISVREGTLLIYAPHGAFPPV